MNSSETNPVVWTRAQFGTLLNDQFVDRQPWEFMKEFTSLPPADYWLEDQIVEFEVGSSEIIRPRYDTHRYFVGSNFRQQSVYTRMESLLQKPITYMLATTSIKPIELDRITISRLRVDKEPFVISPTGEFCDVSIISRHRVVINEYYGRMWTWRFKEVFKFPKKEVVEPSRLYFDSPPRYQIEVSTPGFVTDAELTSFLAASLPKLYNNYRPHVYYLAP